MTTRMTARSVLADNATHRARPADRAAMFQSWQELLFAHWRMEPEIVQRRLPKGLTVQTFEGDAWVGIVPFFMRGIRPWWAPAVPGISYFQEVNLRTYAVDRKGNSGVWFLSLDANTRLGVWWARTFFHLPYYYARMTHSWDRNTGSVEFTSHRPTAPHLASRFAYRPVSVETREAVPGSLEFFLVERYALFAATRRSQIAVGRVHHAPYQFADAELEADDALFELNGLPRPGRPPDHAVVCRGVDVDVFALQAPMP